MLEYEVEGIEPNDSDINQFAFKADVTDRMIFYEWSNLMTYARAKDWIMKKAARLNWMKVTLLKK